MIRQLTNLVRLGRLRTAADTRHRRRPAFLKDHSEFEFRDMLELVATKHGRTDGAFFFIQIGAFDGRTQDPLFHLVREHRWKGILVEPQEQAFDRLTENYADQPQLTFFNVAIGPANGTVELYTRKNGPVLIASLHRHLLIKPGHGSGEIATRTVPCWTLGSLLDRAGAPDHVDLLQIDAEGHDFEIIRAIDFTRIKPTILRFEHVLLSDRDWNACLALLAKQGYRFLLEDRDTTALLREGI